MSAPGEKPSINFGSGAPKPAGHDDEAVDEQRAERAKSDARRADAERSRAIGRAAAAPGRRYGRG